MAEARSLLHESNVAGLREVISTAREYLLNEDYASALAVLEGPLPPVPDALPPLREVIAADAKKEGHTPGEWEQKGEQWVIFCSTCGERAVVANGECEFDDLQDACEVRRG